MLETWSRRKLPGNHLKIFQLTYIHASVAFTMGTCAHVLPRMQKQTAKQYGDAVIQTKIHACAISGLPGIKIANR